MTDLTKQPVFLPRTRATEATRKPLCLTTFIAGLLFTIISFLTGCGGGGGAGSDPTVTVTPGSAGATASLDWNPVPDSTVTAYFVHYGQQSPHQAGSCAYDHSISVDSPSATITNLDPNTTYYFAVSAYNGLESPCSNEVSTST